MDTPTVMLPASSGFGSSRLGLAELLPDCGLGLDWLRPSANSQPAATWLFCFPWWSRGIKLGWCSLGITFKASDQKRHLSLPPTSIHQGLPYGQGQGQRDRQHSAHREALARERGEGKTVNKRCYHRGGRWESRAGSNPEP